MKIVLSDVGVALEGWRDVSLRGDETSDIRSGALEFLDARGADVAELLVVGLFERHDASYARAVFDLIGARLPADAAVTAIVPDADAAFAALDARRVTDDEVGDWFDMVYGGAVDPWCAGARDVAALVAEADLGSFEPTDLPLGLPPGLAQWRRALRLRRDVEPGTDVSREDEELHHRLRKLASTRNLQGVAGPPELVEAHPTMSRARELLERFLPRGGRRRALARAGFDALRETQDYVDRVQEIATQSGLRDARAPSYRAWCRTHDATALELTDQRVMSQTARDPVTVHCIVLARGSWRDVRATVDSLRRQSWAHWRATVVGRGLGWLRSDARIAHRRADASDSAALVNEVVADPDTRAFVVVLEAGDTLAPDACFRIADTAATDPLVDLVYWDDDIAAPGRRSDPRFRPAWSPEMLLGANYLNTSFAIRRRVLLGVGGLREGLGSDAWWDVLLRTDLVDERVARVPRVLSHLRRRPEGVGPHGVDVVAAHLDRIGAAARAVGEPGVVRIEWQLEEWPHVTIVVPTRHNRSMLEGSLPGIARTDYPSFDVIVVDNGGRTDEREHWYANVANDLGLELDVVWWDDDFNYSAVNNAAARRARGSVLVFVNDDTEFPERAWLRELVGWATRPEIGVVGLQLTGPDGTIQHGGVVLGLNGFADHLFEGMPPGSQSLLGPTAWYRNTLSVTAACAAIERDVFEELGGFDERFRLCGSDVVLGLDAVVTGRRNVCSPFGGVRHLESVTRGTHVPQEDFFASYWRYQRWIFAGDPFFSPSLSLGSRVPQLRSRFEPTPADRMAEPLGREIKVFRQSTDEGELDLVARGCRVTDADVEAIHTLHAHNVEPFAPKTVNWFFPELDSPFYGGINTALRIADHLARVHGVENRFVLWAHPNDGFHRSAIAAAFPTLADAPIYYDLSLRAAAGIPACDVSISTLWVTAFVSAHFANARRKFYLIQDFEPMFYPAGTMYALAEESYRLDHYGLCNTENLLQLYERYGGQGTAFSPAVDRNVFHAVGRRERRPDEPVTVFVYARPGHWRNCWELAELALEELKSHLGDRVRIVTAGSWARPEDVGSGIQHLGLLDYRETGALYRTCDVGVALTVSEHPSYLPLELMACGVPVVAFDNPAGYWLLRDEENCLLARRTVDGLSNQLERMVVDHELRASLAERGLHDIDEGYASWDKALSGIYEYLSDPERVGRD
jgi:glycosyltransferase involved in cell wall biosynthesis